MTSLISIGSPERWKRWRANLFCLLALGIVAFSAQTVRAQLKPKQVRKLITRMAGFELKNGDVRVKTISTTSGGTAEAVAEIRTVFKFEKDIQGIWRVAEIRTGPSHWEEIGLIATALHTEGPANECNALDPPFKGEAAIDPSVKRARCLLGSLLGVEGPSDAVRIQEVDPFVIPLAPQPSALVVAWVRVDVQLESDGKVGWQVTALRTGKRYWVKLEPLLASVNELKQKTARTELESIAKALDQFRADRGFYVVADKQAVVIDQLSPRYLSQVIRVDPWHQPYKYQGDRDHFTLSSAGPDGKEDTPDDIKLSRPSG
jgi:hypothetical protein